ncbi:BRO family protein [Acetobacter pasteurianus]|uniref:Bro-N domain-containing protein n=1 Tax=Acetobacter pasteurianus subsp. pasteurianus TaxID=481145 RepID=A0AAC9X0E9_ACEPA|nr:BRO family protein [Acetobacter pasteurianus]ASC05166.1 uncharacterized protein S101468_00899 [Acetobacter pasteurianus subsp. pasteurianus]
MSSVITSGVTPAIIPFNFEGAEVRVNDRNGEPWWVLADVCKVLEIANAPHAASRLDDNEKTTIAISDSGNLNADRTIINESGLWSLVLTSRKPAAKRFKKWITSEVIPSIRKTGSYSVNQPPKPKRIRKPAFDTAFTRCMNVVALLPNVDENQKVLMAARGTYNLTGVNPLEVMGYAALPARTEDNYKTPTELGKGLGLSGRRVNQILSEEAHLQVHTPGSASGSDWSMTEKGLPYGKMFDTTRKGGKGSQQQLKWKPSVIEFLRPFAVPSA